MVKGEVAKHSGDSIHHNTHTECHSNHWHVGTQASSLEASIDGNR